MEAAPPGGNLVGANGDAACRGSGGGWSSILHYLCSQDRALLTSSPQTVRDHDSLIVRMQSTIASLKKTVVDNFSKTLRDAIEAQLEESDDVRRVVASLQKQQARDKVGAEKRFSAIEATLGSLKASMAELQQLRRGGQEKQDHTIHGVVHNMDLMRKEMAGLREVIERWVLRGWGEMGEGGSLKSRTHKTYVRVRRLTPAAETRPSRLRRTRGYATRKDWRARRTRGSPPTLRRSKGS